MTRRAGGLIVVLVMLIAVPAAASVAVENFMQTSVAAAGEGTRVYEYGSGALVSADFSTGGHDGTVNNGGELELISGGPDWWDVAWQRRQCFDITNPSAAAVAEYPLRFEVDTTGSSSTGADIRVVQGTSGPQLLPYSEGPFTDTETVVWAKAAPLAAGDSSYCVYFDNPVAPSVSSEAAVFAPTSGQVVRYYTMVDGYNKADLHVVSYTNNNTVSDGNSTVVLNQGGLHTFKKVDRDTVITATGPIEGSANEDGVDTLIPESFAHDEFVFSLSRGDNAAWVRAPFGATEIEVWVDGKLKKALKIKVKDNAKRLAVDFDGAQTFTLRSVDGTDFLAVYETKKKTDVVPAIHSYGDPLYGIRSRTVSTAAIGTANITLRGSNGAVVTAVASDLVSHSQTNDADTRGNGVAFEVTSDGPLIAGFQHDDGTGTESTAFFPKRRLAETWRTPVASSYVAVACPTNPTTVTIGGTAFACNGAAGGPGFAYGGLVNRPAGLLITADNPVYVYYEAANADPQKQDERNLIGFRGAIPHLDGLVVSPDPVEINSGDCGEWVSDPIAVSGVFGLSQITHDIPAGGSATYQISTDGSAFYGPDGTAASSFADGDIIGYLSDFASALALRIELCSTSPTAVPTVSEFVVESNLTELVADENVTTSLALTSAPSPTIQPLVRIYQDHAGPWQGSVEYLAGNNLVALTATVTTDHPTTQIIVSAGTATSSSPPFSHSQLEPYSVILDHATATGETAELSFNLAATSGVRLEKTLRLVLTG